MPKTHTPPVASEGVDPTRDYRPVDLTEPLIAAFKPTAVPRIVRDTKLKGLGLGLRITPSGHKSFVLCYRFDGKERRLPICTWIKGEATLGWARTQAAELKLKVQSGIDPVTEQIDKREAREASKIQAAKEVTFAKLADRYEKEHAAGKRSGKADVSRIARHLRGPWGNRKVKDIGRADLRAIVSAIAAGDLDAGIAPRPAEAQHVLAVARNMFSFAVDQEILPLNPLLGLTKIPGVGVSGRRRALTTARELRTLWRVTEPESLWTKPMPHGWYKTKWKRINPAEAACLRFMLMTGARPTEAAELPWSEIDFDEYIWTLPDTRSKNGRVHIVPLVPEAIDLLKERINNGSDFVFPGQRGAKSVTVNRLGGALRKMRGTLLRLGIEPVKPHDLRKTVSTGMAKMRVPREYRDRVLNHADTSIDGKHYNEHEFLEEKREALEKWVLRLRQLLEGDKASNVVQLRGRK